MRDALVERRRLHRLAPHLVRPLNFVMPVWKGPRASMFMLSAGLFLYDLLAGGGQPVPRHRRFSKQALLQRFPYVDPVRLLGGFRYGDCQEDDARMTLTVVAAAQAAGALVANRMKATALLREGDGVTGARVQDLLNDEAFELRAKAIVNATGPWAAELLGDAGPRVKRIKGIHIVLPAIPDCDDAFLLTANDGRVFFVIPWYGRTLVGTTEQEIAALDRIEATDDEVRYLLGGVRNGLPGITWTENDVIARYAGVRTLQPEEADDPSAITREFTVLQPLPNLLMPLGGKFTTARCDAIEIVDGVQKALGIDKTPSLTARRPLPGTPETGEPFERWQSAVIPLLKQRGVAEDLALSLTLRHGTRIGRLAELIAQDPGLAGRLHPESDFIRAEAVLAVQDEMAWSLEDVLRRRIPLALLARLDPGWVRGLAADLAPHWRRDPAELVQEFLRGS